MKIITEENTTQNVEMETSKGLSENKAPHKRAYYVEKTRKALGTKQNGDKYTFGHINGVTSEWSVNKIKSRYNECKKADIPFAPLWWWKKNQES